jgi:hypothetical protein
VDGGRSPALDRLIEAFARDVRGGRGVDTVDAGVPANS